MLMVAATPIGARVATPKLTDVELDAWIAQAEAGARIEYHRGFLGIDVTPVISTLPEPERRQLADLGQAALDAFEKGLVHLVQERVGPDRFAYIAVARTVQEGKGSGQPYMSGLKEKAVGFKFNDRFKGTIPADLKAKMALAEQDLISGKIDPKG